MPINERTLTMPGQWAADAHTNIPNPPLPGQAYRDTGVDAANLRQGQLYDRVYDSARHNQLNYLLTGLLQTLERYGVPPWSGLTDYPEHALCLGPDGALYQAVQPSGPAVSTASGEVVGPVNPLSGIAGYWLNLSADLPNLTAWRQSHIGIPRWWRSASLPPNHIWADGSLALFADWPEFAEIYQAGGFEGMTLPADSDSATLAANPAKWVEHPESSGLYAPRLGGWFMRNWTPGQSKDAGRNSGSAQAATDFSTRDIWQAVYGASYYSGQNINNYDSIETYTPSSTNAHVGTIGVLVDYTQVTTLQNSKATVRPANLAQPVCIYLGNPA